MHNNFKDITSRIEDEPSWYDQNGTPRYGRFYPNLSPNIYADNVGFFLIECQDCGKKFKVEMHSLIWHRDYNDPPKLWHYGDPPNHGCVGDSMNCIDLKVMQFWTRDRVTNKWKRLKELEGKMNDE